jgi:hypothetical protein
MDSDEFHVHEIEILEIRSSNAIPQNLVGLSLRNCFVVMLRSIKIPVPQNDSPEMSANAMPCP